MALENFEPNIAIIRAGVGTLRRLVKGSPALTQPQAIAKAINENPNLTPGQREAALERLKLALERAARVQTLLKLGESFESAQRKAGPIPDFQADPNIQTMAPIPQPEVETRPGPTRPAPPSVVTPEGDLRGTTPRTGPDTIDPGKRIVIPGPKGPGRGKEILGEVLKRGKTVGKILIKNIPGVGIITDIGSIIIEREQKRRKGETAPTTRTPAPNPSIPETGEIKDIKRGLPPTDPTKPKVPRSALPQPGPLPRSPDDEILIKGRRPARKLPTGAARTALSLAILAPLGVAILGAAGRRGGRGLTLPVTPLPVGAKPPKISEPRTPPAPVPTPLDPLSPQPFNPFFPVPQPFADGQTSSLTTQQTKKCQEVTRRRRRKGKCREGFFREKPGSTQFITWRERQCR